MTLLKKENIPVAMGAHNPLVRRPRYSSDVRGDDGMANNALPNPTTYPISLHAIDQIISEIRRASEPVTLVATGALTNIALAIAKDPDGMKKIKELVVMGGTIVEPGNVSPVAEANFFRDPEAAKVVTNSNLLLTMVPLDVTHKVILTPRTARAQGY